MKLVVLALNQRAFVTHKKENGDIETRDGSLSPYTSGTFDYYLFTKNLQGDITEMARAKTTSAVLRH